MKTVGDDKIIITCHVDDFLAVSTSDALLDELCALLASQYGDSITTHEGDLLKYMGLSIRRCEIGDVFVSQPAYYKKLW